MSVSRSTVDSAILELVGTLGQVAQREIRVQIGEDLYTKHRPASAGVAIDTALKRLEGAGKILRKPNLRGRGLLVELHGLHGGGRRPRQNDLSPAGVQTSPRRRAAAQRERTNPLAGLEVAREKAQRSALLPHGDPSIAAASLLAYGILEIATALRERR